MAVVRVDIEYQDEDNGFHTRYNSSKYPDVAQRVNTALRHQLSGSGISHGIHLNPGPGKGWAKFRNHTGLYVSRSDPSRRCRYPRLGAFEVVVKCSPECSASWCPESGIFTAWSKLNTLRWPDPERLAQHITRELTAMGLGAIGNQMNSKLLDASSPLQSRLSRQQFSMGNGFMNSVEQRTTKMTSRLSRPSRPGSAPLVRSAASGKGFLSASRSQHELRPMSQGVTRRSPVASAASRSARLSSLLRPSSVTAIKDCSAEKWRHDESKPSSSSSSSSLRSSSSSSLSSSSSSTSLSSSELSSPSKLSASSSAAASADNRACNLQDVGPLAEKQADSRCVSSLSKLSASSLAAASALNRPCNLQDVGPSAEKQADSRCASSPSKLSASSSAAASADNRACNLQDVGPSAEKQADSRCVSEAACEIDISISEGLLSGVLRFFRAASYETVSKTLIQRWLADFLRSSLTGHPRLELCFHGTTMAMASMLMKSGFRLPQMHPLLYTTPEFKVANFYASSIHGGFHSACGAEFQKERQAWQSPDRKAASFLPGKVFLCLGFNPNVGTAYMKFSRAGHLLPCCTVESENKASIAKKQFEVIRLALLNMLPGGIAQECMQAWSLQAKNG